MQTEQLNPQEQEALKAAEGAVIEDHQGNKVDTVPQVVESVEEAEPQLNATEDEKPEHEETVEEQPEATADENAEVEKLREELADLKAEKEEQAVLELAGGQENYQQLTDWAGKSLPDKEIEMYNAVMDSGSQEQKTFAVRALKAMYELEMGREGNILGGDTPDESGSYASDEEFYADLNTPLYKEDSPAGEAFRAKVASKMARMTTTQNIAGWVNA